MNYKRFINIVDRYFEAYLSLAILSVYSTIIVLDTLRRILIGKQTLWGHEIVVALFIWMTWISAAYVIRYNGHLRFEFFLRGFTNRQRGVVALVENVIWVAFAGIVLWHSIDILDIYVTAGRTFSGTDIPSYLSYLSIPVGFTLIVIRSVQQVILSTLKLREDEEFTFEMEDMV